MNVHGTATPHCSRFMLCVCLEGRFLSTDLRQGLFFLQRLSCFAVCCRFMVADPFHNQLGFSLAGASPFYILFLFYRFYYLTWFQMFCFFVLFSHWWNMCLFFRLRAEKMYCLFFCLFVLFFTDRDNQWFAICFSLNIAGLEGVRFLALIRPYVLYLDI